MRTSDGSKLLQPKQSLKLLLAFPRPDPKMMKDTEIYGRTKQASALHCSIVHCKDADCAPRKAALWHAADCVKLACLKNHIARRSSACKELPWKALSWLFKV